MKVKELLSVFSLFVLLSQVSWAQPAPNKTDSQGRKQGAWERFYENGNPVYRVTFVNDKPTGTMTRFYEEGGIQALVEYGENGFAEAKLFYPDSLGLMAEGAYLNQKKHGTWLLYAPDSTLNAKENYLKGKKNGVSIVYFSDGSISERAEYVDDLKNGLWEQFYENGNPKLRATVVDGIQYEGEYVSYYSNGNKIDKGKYREGRKTSSWYHFHENGSLEVIYLYRYGKVIEEHPKNGLFENYYPGDIRESEYTYKDGEKNGPFVEYFHMGEWVTEEATDEYGNKYPVQRMYGTQVKRSGSFKNGKLHGEVKTYNEKGKLVSTEQYVDGVLED